MTPEEIYAKHHKTATRPNPFLPNDTLKAMEEYAEQQSKKSIEETKALYGPETIGMVDDYNSIKEDLKKAGNYINLLLCGGALSYFSDRQAATNFSLYLDEKYDGLKTRKLSNEDLEQLKGKRK